MFIPYRIENIKKKVIGIFDKLKRNVSSLSGRNTALAIVLKNVSWIFTGKLFYALSNLVVSIIITRYLGPENNGVFNYVLAFTALFSAISGMGMEEVTVKEFNVRSVESGNILFSGFILKLFGGIAACGLAIVSSWIVRMSYEKMVYVVIISISFVFQAFDIFLYWFQSQSNNKIVVLCQNTIRIIFIILKLLLAIFKGNLLHFVIITALETIVLSVSLPFVYRHNSIKTSALKFDKNIFFKIFNLSWPMILSSIAASVYMKIDQVMIGAGLGDYELGIYSVAVKLAESWYFVPVGVAAAVLPFIAKAYNESEEKMYKLFQIYADGMTLMAYIASLLISLFARQIIYILFGNEYLSADSLLVLYVWSGIFVNFGLIRGAYISIKECTKIGMYGTILGAVGNIALNFLLIPVYGAKGAVWATIITQMLSAFLSSFFFDKTKRLAFIQLFSLFPFVRLFELLKQYKKNKPII